MLQTMYEILCLRVTRPLTSDHSRVLVFGCKCVVFLLIIPLVCIHFAHLPAKEDGLKCSPPPVLVAAKHLLVREGICEGVGGERQERECACGCVGVYVCV